jgi:hypothetical protein
VGKIDHMRILANYNGVSADASTTISITESTIGGNINDGVLSTGSVRATNSEVSNNGFSGIVLQIGVVTGCVIANNGSSFTNAAGVKVGATAAITNNQILGNFAGIGGSSGATPGYGMNTFAANFADVNLATAVSMKNNVTSAGTLF